MALAVITLFASVSPDSVFSQTRSTTLTIDGNRFVVPAGSPMQHWSKTKEPNSGADFSGSFLLTGTLVYFGPTPDFYGKNSDPPAWYILPDRATASRLPFVKNEGKPPNNFLLGPQLTRSDFLPAVLRRVVDSSKGRKVAVAPVSLHVKAYSLFFDGCGVAEYAVNGVSIDHAEIMQLARPPRLDQVEDC